MEAINVEHIDIVKVEIVWAKGLSPTIKSFFFFF